MGCNHGERVGVQRLTIIFVVEGRSLRVIRSCPAMPQQHKSTHVHDGANNGISIINFETNCNTIRLIPQERNTLRSTMHNAAAAADVNPSVPIDCFRFHPNVLLTLKLYDWQCLRSLYNTTKAPQQQSVNGGPVSAFWDRSYRPVRMKEPFS